MVFNSVRVLLTMCRNTSLVSKLIANYTSFFKSPVIMTDRSKFTIRVLSPDIAFIWCWSSNKLHSSWKGTFGWKRFTPSLNFISHVRTSLLKQQILSTFTKKKSFKFYNDPYQLNILRLPRLFLHMFCLGYADTLTKIPLFHCTWSFPLWSLLAQGQMLIL